jgi:hypothetical protein
MHYSPFLSSCATVQDNDTYFIQRRDDARRGGQLGVSNVTTAVGQLAYGTYLDTENEQVRTGETTTIVSQITSVPL